MVRQGWEAGVAPGHVPGKGTLTVMVGEDAPVEAGVGDGSSLRTPGGKKPTLQEVGRTAGQTSARALSYREAGALSGPQSGPGTRRPEEGDLSPPRKPSV